MTEDEQTALAVLQTLLDLTDKGDWRLIHATVRADVASGRFSPNFGRAYRNMVDDALASRAKGNKETAP